MLVDFAGVRINFSVVGFYKSDDKNLSIELYSVNPGGSENSKPYYEIYFETIAELRQAMKVLDKFMGVVKFNDLVNEKTNEGEVKFKIVS